MPVGTINLKYTTKKLEVQKQIDTRVNVKDSVEYLRFSTIYDENGVGVSYINSPSVDVEKNILITDYSESISGNSKKTKIEIEHLSDSFVLDFANFFITDIVHKDVDGNDLPLYFWHDLSSWENISKVELLYEDMSPVPGYEWILLDESSVLKKKRFGIYTNLQCKYILREKAAEVYYVRFLDKNTNQVVLQVLDSKQFYTQASFFSERTERQFIISQISSGYQVDVVFDSMNYGPTNTLAKQRFYIRDREKGKIFIERPAASLVSQRWNLRVSPGDFHNNGRRYWVPEYYTQRYSPAFPYRLEKEREVLIINNQLLYTDLFPICNLGINGFYIYVSIKNSAGELVRAFTNDPDADVFITKNGYQTDIYYEKDMISHVSENSGFIRLVEKLPGDCRAFLTFRYIENYYTYTELSVNPSITPDILGKRILLYVLPDQKERSIHHLILDDKSSILDASESDKLKSFSGKAESGTNKTITDSSLGVIDNYSGFEIEILSGKNSGIKTKITDFIPSSHSLVLADTLPNIIELGVYYRIIKKLENYSTEDSTTGTIHTYQGWEGYAKNIYALKIADTYVVQSLNISDIQSFDSRILGGGIKDSKIDAATKLQDEVRWFWDLGDMDGTPYPGMGAILVELPRYILKEIGGGFERSQVREIVSKHMAEGSYPVIRYYDNSTEITKLIPSNGKVFVEWGSIDATQYNIYIGNSMDNVSLYSSQPGTRNTATITGLENNKIYYIQIEPIVGGIARLRSRVLSFMPFNFSNTLPIAVYDKNKFLGSIYA